MSTVKSLLVDKFVHEAEPKANTSLPLKAIQFLA